MRAFLLLLTAFLVGCHHPSPLPAGTILAPPLEAEEIACPEDPLRFFFTTPTGTCSLLYRFDDRLMDVVAFPGAGMGLRNTFGVGDDSVLFDRAGIIYRYYWKRDRLCVYPDASEAGFAANPAWDGKNLFFLATNDPALAALGYGDLAVILDADGPCPVLCSLEEINLVTRSHGSIVSYSVSRAGGILVLTTGDGWLFSAPWSGERAGPLLDTGIRDAGDIEIESGGRLVAWADKRMKRIALSSRYSLDSCAFEDLRFLPSPFGCITAVSGLGFRGKLPRYLTYKVTFPDARTHVVAYDLCLDWTRTLAVYNTIR